MIDAATRCKFLTIRAGSPQVKSEIFGDYADGSRLELELEANKLVFQYKLAFVTVKETPSVGGQAPEQV